MIERTSSPEERLLRLIRGQSADRPPAPAAPPATTRPPRRWVLRPTLSMILWALNGLFVVLLVGLVAASVWALVRPAALPTLSTPTAPLALPPPPGDPPALEMQVFQRLLFQGSMGTPQVATPDEAARRQQAQGAIAGLSLIGIMDGQPPQAIVADAQTQKTYFLKVGETFGDGLVLEKIEEGRIVLRANGVELELRL